AHVLAIRYALEPVLSELGAQHIIQGAYTIDHQVKRADNGRFEMEREAARRLERALRQFEENLQRLEASPVISH
ncbi:FMN reductase (NADPH), partial [Salmonella enterica subsp. enterica serovar Istanbul]|nr:FMN reductase (NADPH) [Salmonella enterica subsp. enterica serovar Istanbul]